MGRRVDVGQLVVTRAAADRLGLVRVQAFHHYRQTWVDRDPAFPAPVYWRGRQGGPAIWYWPDIWRWAKRSGRPELVGLAALATFEREARREVAVEHLVGSAEIGERFEVNPQRTHHLSTEAGFPARVFPTGEQVGDQRLWSWPEVRRWAVKRGRHLADGF